MEEENYYNIQSIIEDVFRDQTFEGEVFFYDEIPDSIISVFNESLENDFKENIEYLLFYNDSIDETGRDGIAIVKKEENYYLILKEHRRKYPVIFFLHSEFEMWEINSFCLDEVGYLFSITTDIDAKVINGYRYYTVEDTSRTEPVKSRVYTFEFYNNRFLRLLIELCEQIDNELGE